MRQFGSEIEQLTELVPASVVARTCVTHKLRVATDDTFGLSIAQ
jgi:hypothetical protein